MEKASLLEWKRYRLLLIRVDVLQASDVQRGTSKNSQYKK
ncbi:MULTISPECIES: tail fiber assembly protein [Photorhabdus]|nr:MULTISPECIES: tail fiber assembly protein [Photorhabdus]